MAAAILVHNILPRVWRIAYGQYEMPRGLDSEDFHAYTRAKAYRAKLWLNHGDTSWKSYIVVVCSGPANHLLQQVQHLDAAGGALQELASSKANPFLQCLRGYLSLLVDDDSPTSLISYHFEGHGKEVVAMVMAFVLKTCLAIAGLVWKHLLCFYRDWRYRLLGLTSPYLDEAQKQQLATDFCKLKPCCLDRHFTAKARMAE